MFWERWYVSTRMGTGECAPAGAVVIVVPRDPGASLPNWKRVCGPQRGSWTPAALFAGLPKISYCYDLQVGVYETFAVYEKKTQVCANLYIRVIRNLGGSLPPLLP